MNQDELIDKVLSLIPQTSPFRFIDTIKDISKEQIIGEYQFKEDEYFYAGHFPTKPVTPGVILTECAAQTALVAHLIYHLLVDNDQDMASYEMAFTSSNVEFLKPVWPGEKVTVHGTKQYIRFHKMKTSVKMYDSAGDIVCKGELSGMYIMKK